MSGIVSQMEKRFPTAVLYEDRNNWDAKTFKGSGASSFHPQPGYPKHSPRLLQTPPLRLQLPARAAALRMHCPHVTRPRARPLTT